MGLLDELKKLTKPYDDEDYLEENLAEPVRVGGQPAAGRGYAAYAEPPRAADPAQPTRRPYVFSQRGAQAQQAQTYAQQPAYDNAYAQQGYADGYAHPQGYAQQSQGQQTYAQAAAYAPQGGQPRLLLVRPDRFEVAADIADRIRERNAIVLNLENTQKDTTRRILDFLSGVTYALGGTVKRVSGNTFIITPSGMDFAGDAYEEPQTSAGYF